MTRTCLIAAFTAVALPGCFFEDHGTPPTVELLDPIDTIDVTSFDPVRLSVAVSDVDSRIASVQLRLDGEPTELLEDVALPEDGNCRDGCALELDWHNLRAPEGDFELEVIAIDTDGNLGRSGLPVHLEDTPAATFDFPRDAFDLRGIGFATVVVDVVDRSRVEPELRIDGVVVAANMSPTQGGCATGCAVSYGWNTLGYADGAHTLTASATDALGNATTVEATVSVADLVYVSAIEVQEETDGFGALEIEVHMYDADTGEYLGCSGAGSGLEDVDENNRQYAVIGLFQRPAAGPLTRADIEGRNLFVDVIEDDELPCPRQISGPDDSLGRSPTFAAAAVSDMPPLAFDDVVHLALTTGRPLTR